jgi:DNA invertase Pin-like site-specific DNA recombinase/transposase
MNMNHSTNRASLSDQAAHSMRTVRVAVYVRVSTEEQNKGYGPDVQIETCTEYVERKPGWQIVRVFRDDGVSGQLIDRPGMWELERAAQPGEIDVVVLHKFDRIGRTGRSFWAWVGALEDLGVRIVSVTQEIDTTTPNGRMLLNFYAGMAEGELVAIRDRLDSGRQQKARAGGWPGGPAPYGYRIDGKGQQGSILAVYESEADTVRTIVDLVAVGGLDCATAARRLYEQGRRRRNGSPWTTASVHSVLRGEAVLGYTTFRSSKRTGGKAKNVTQLAADGTPLLGEPVRIELPRVLSDEQLSAVTEWVARPKTYQRPDNDYPLSGVLYGTCGGRYVGNLHANGLRRTYVCGERRRGKPCEDRAIDAQAIEDVVWGYVVELLEDPAKLHKLVSDKAVKLPGDKDRLAARLARLTKTAKAKEAALSRTIAEFANERDVRLRGLVQETIRTLLDELKAAESEAEEATAQLSEWDARQQFIEKTLLLADEARFQLRDITEAEKREMIQVLDLRVDILESGLSLREGRPCRVRRWHESTGTPIPADVTAEEWPELARLLNEEFKSHTVSTAERDRLAVNAMLTRLRSGILWDALPIGFGLMPTIRSRQSGWWNAGKWPRVIAILSDHRVTTPFPLDVAVPPFRLSGDLAKAVMYAGTERESGAQAARKATDPLQRASTLRGRDDPSTRLF